MILQIKTDIAVYEQNRYKILKIKMLLNFSYKKESTLPTLIPFESKF